MSKQVKNTKEGKIEDVIKLVKGVAEQTRRASDRVALQAAREEIRRRGEFVPKHPQPVDQVKICF